MVPTHRPLLTPTPSPSERGSNATGGRRMEGGRAVSEQAVAWREAGRRQAHRRVGEEAPQADGGGEDGVDAESVVEGQRPGGGGGGRGERVARAGSTPYRSTAMLERRRLSLAEAPSSRHRRSHGHIRLSLLFSCREALLARRHRDVLDGHIRESPSPR